MGGDVALEYLGVLGFGDCELQQGGRVLDLGELELLIHLPEPLQLLTIPRPQHKLLFLSLLTPNPIIKHPIRLTRQLNKVIRLLTLGIIINQSTQRHSSTSKAAISSLISVGFRF